MKGENAKFAVLLGTFFVFVIVTMSYKVEETYLMERILMSANRKAGHLIDGVIWAFTGCFFAIALLVNIDKLFAKYLIIVILCLILIYSLLGLMGSFLLRGSFMTVYEELFSKIENERDVIAIQNRNKCCGWGSPVIYPIIGNCTHKTPCDELIAFAFDSRRGTIVSYHLLIAFITSYVLYQASMLGAQGSTVIE